jgi:signal transduction histidine kinase
MKKTIDMLIAIKKPWLDQMISLVSESRGQTWRPESNELSKFWDLTTDAYLRGEPEAIKPVLEPWLQTYFASEMDTGKLSSDIHPVSIRLLSLCEHACLHAAMDLFSDAERLRLQAEVISLFGQFYELAASLELGMYMHELRRREEAVRHEVQQLDQTRSNFINIAAHGLKTPLTLIEGYTEMLAESLGTEDRNPDHEVLMRGIRTGTTKMRRIIDELIDISMVDNQMLSLYYQPVKIGDILENIAKALEGQIQEKSLNFEIKSLGDAAKPTYADEERLMQAFLHVLRNAVQYTPSGGTVEIKGRVLPGFIEISCRDTGVGIAREDQAIIFDKFGRVPDSLARSGAGVTEKDLGSGLGLHLAKGILEAHGGTIWVESPGKDEETCPGSIFHMMIPLRDQAPDDIKMQRFGPYRRERFG